MSFDIWMRWISTPGWRAQYIKGAAPTSFISDSLISMFGSGVVAGIEVVDVDLCVFVVGSTGGGEGELGVAVVPESCFSVFPVSLSRV